MCWTAARQGVIFFPPLFDGVPGAAWYKKTSGTKSLRVVSHGFHGAIAIKGGQSCWNGA
jgi:hypothetical protein